MDADKGFGWLAQFRWGGRTSSHPHPSLGSAQAPRRRRTGSGAKGKQKAPNVVVVLMTIATYLGLGHHGASPLVGVQRGVSSPGAVAQRGNRYLYGTG